MWGKNKRGELMNCNLAALPHFGVEREQDIVGKTVFQLFDSLERAEASHADDLSVMGGRPLLNRIDPFLDAEGRSDFHMMQQRMNVARPSKTLIAQARPRRDRRPPGRRP